MYHLYDGPYFQSLTSSNIIFHHLQMNKLNIYKLLLKKQKQNDKILLQREHWTVYIIYILIFVYSTWKEIREKLWIFKRVRLLNVFVYINWTEWKNKTFVLITNKNEIVKFIFPTKPKIYYFKRIFFCVLVPLACNWGSRIFQKIINVHSFFWYALCCYNQSIYICVIILSVMHRYIWKGHWWIWTKINHDAYMNMRMV